MFCNVIKFGPVLSELQVRRQRHWLREIVFFLVPNRHSAFISMSNGKFDF